jgi:hypothetical protein
MRQRPWSMAPMGAIALLGGRRRGVRLNALLAPNLFFCLLHYFHLQLVP